MSGNPGAAAYVQAMGSLARRQVPKAPTYAQLATVNPDFSLALDWGRGACPPGGYYVLDYLVGVLNPMTTTLSTSGHTHGVPRPPSFLPLVPGDRVLVVLVNNGGTPVVIGRVMASLPLVVP